MRLKSIFVKLCIVLCLSLPLSACQTQTEPLVQLTGLNWYGEVTNPAWPYKLFNIRFYVDENPLYASFAMGSKELVFVTDITSGSRRGNSIHLALDADLDPRIEETAPVTIDAQVTGTLMTGEFTSSKPGLNFKFTAHATTSSPPQPDSVNQ